MFVRLRSDGSGSYKAFRAVYIAVYDTEGTVMVKRSIVAFMYYQ